MRKLSDGRFYFLASVSDEPQAAANGAGAGIWDFALQGYMPAQAEQQ